MRSPNILVVSDSQEIQEAFANILSNYALLPIAASTTDEAATVLERRSISLVFCSDGFPRDAGTREFIRRTSQAPRSVPVVVVSRFDDWAHYVRYLQAGALDYVLYPLNEHEVVTVTKNGLRAVMPIQWIVEGKGERAKITASCGVCHTTQILIGEPEQVIQASFNHCEDLAEAIPPGIKSQYRDCAALG